MANPNPLPRNAAQRERPVRDALRMEAKALEAGEIIEHPTGSLRWIAQRQLLRAGEETAGFNVVADRLDGKVPQAIVGDDEHAPIQVAASDEERVKALQALLQKASGKGVA
jgi:hypothetical protein